MLKTRQPRRQSGMTLIELMITIAIITIVLTLALPNFREWLQSLQIRAAAESILNGLNLARAEAVKRNQSVTFTLTNLNASSWTVTDPSAAPPTIQTRSSTEGSLNAQVATTLSPITFDPLGRITPLPPAAVVINVTNPTGGACATASGPMRCLNITVSASGQIRMCDPAFTIAANPIGC